MALLDDDEFADQMLDLMGDEPSSAPPAADWSPEVSMMAKAVDRLGEAVAALIGLGGGRPPQIKPEPRPRTAWDRARGRRSLGRHLSLVAEVEEARARRQALRD